MKKNIVFLYTLISFWAYAEIKVKCNPIVFKEIRIQNGVTYDSKTVARGVIEIYSDNLKEDFGKLISFQAPPYTYMTNNKRSVKTENIKFNKNKAEIVLTEENEKIVFHIILDKRKLSNEKNKELIDGVYTGLLSLNYSIYDKEI